MTKNHLLIAALTLLSLNPSVYARTNSKEPLETKRTAQAIEPSPAISGQATPSISPGQVNSRTDTLRDPIWEFSGTLTSVITFRVRCKTSAGELRVDKIARYGEADSER
jgi:hypothetical protein